MPIKSPFWLFYGSSGFFHVENIKLFTDKSQVQPERSYDMFLIKCAFVREKKELREALEHESNDLRLVVHATILPENCVLQGLKTAIKAMPPVKNLLENLNNLLNNKNLNGSCWP